MKYSQNSAFTLIEFIVAVTIFFLIGTMIFWSYAYYLNKTKVKQTQKEVSQLIYKAKNMALNGIVDEDKNISVWVYFDSSAANKIRVIPFPHEKSLADIQSNSSLLTTALSYTGITTLQLQPGVTFQDISDEDKWLIYFQAITGSGWVLLGNSFSPYSDNTQIDFAYNNATHGSLRKTIEYIPSTQIVDY